MEQRGVGWDRESVTRKRMKSQWIAKEKTQAASFAPVIGMRVWKLALPALRQIRHAHQEAVALAGGTAAFVDGPDDK